MDQQANDVKYIARSSAELVDAIERYRALGNLLPPLHTFSWFKDCNLSKYSASWKSLWKISQRFNEVSLKTDHDVSVSMSSSGECELLRLSLPQMTLLKKDVSHEKSIHFETGKLPAGLILPGVFVCDVTQAVNAFQDQLQKFGELMPEDDFFIPAIVMVMQRLGGLNEQFVIDSVLVSSCLNSERVYSVNIDDCFTDATGNTRKTSFLTSEWNVLLQDRFDEQMRRELLAPLVEALIKGHCECAKEYIAQGLYHEATFAIYLGFVRLLTNSVVGELLTSPESKKHAIDLILGDTTIRRKLWGSEHSKIDDLARVALTGLYQRREILLAS